MKQIQVNKCRIKAFTLLEMLLTLFVVTSLVLLLSGSVHSTFGRVREELFFLEFEQFYKDSQKLSQAQRTRLRLTMRDGVISNGYRDLPLPENVVLLQDYQLEFSSSGGNSSLTKIQFQTDGWQVSYQLQMGSGQYKKTRQRLYSP